jgi:hypothetical protein
MPGRRRHTVQPVVARSSSCPRRNNAANGQLREQYVNARPVSSGSFRQPSRVRLNTPFEHGTTPEPNTE